MIIVLKKNTPKEDVKKLCSQLERKYQISTNPIYGEVLTIIGLVGDTSSIPKSEIALNQIVDKIMKVQEPFKRANRMFHPEDTVIDVGGKLIGSDQFIIVAGPCAVESEEQIETIAKELNECGTGFLRGGAFKPRTSPYSFQGLKAKGIELLKSAGDRYSMPIVTEIVHPYDLELFAEKVDIIQVGARNMQNYELLKELGSLRKPVLLKRGFSNSIEELLMSAEYIMSGGNQEVILCERGIRTFDKTFRNNLDISAVPYLKKVTHLPVFIDPSHAAGIRWMVEPLVRAAIACGADGALVEVHNNPEIALSDGEQSLLPSEFKQMLENIAPLANAVGRRIL